jgi:hypothetical protein
MAEELIPLIVVPAFFILIGLIFWLNHRGSERRAQMRYDLGARTLDKFSTAGEMSQFLETDAGQTFLKILENGEANPAERTLRSLRIGVILSAFGGGFVVLALTADAKFIHPGIIFLSLGLGFIGAAAVSRKLQGLPAFAPGAEVQEISRSPYRDAA